MQKTQEKVTEDLEDKEGFHRVYCLDLNNLISLSNKKGPSKEGLFLCLSS